MRDIRPVPGNKKLLPEGEVTPQLPANETPPTPVTESVPVSNVHLRRGSLVNQAKQTEVTPSRAQLFAHSDSVSSAVASPAVPTPTNVPERVAATPTPPTKRPLRIGQRERRVLFAIFSLVGVASLLAAFIFLPKAEIKLVLRTAPLLVDEQLTVQATGLETGTQNIIPGTVYFREVPVEGTSAVTSTEVIGTKAKGVIQLINRATEEQKIKVNSRLVTKDGVLFYTQKDATLPAAEAGISRTAITVEAAEAGEAGNIAPQRLDFAALPEASQALVYAETTATLTGGSGQTVKKITQTDIDAAKTAAGLQGRQKVEDSIRSELPRDWSLLEESWSSTIEPFETPAKLAEQREDIPYTGRVTVRVLGIAEQKLEEHLRQALEKRLDADYMLFPGRISYTKTIPNIDWEQASATIATRVTHTTMPRLSLDSLREKLAGRSKAEAQQYLAGLPGIRSVTVDLKPFWATSISRISKRIIIDLQPERQP